MSALSLETSQLGLGFDRLPGGDSVVCCHGRVDSTTAESLRQVLRDVEARQTGHVVVLAAGIDAIDREGVGVLLAALRRLRLQNRDLVVTGPSDAVLRALRTMGLHRVLLGGGRLPLDWRDPCFDRL